MKKSFLYIIPLLPLALFYGLVSMNIEDKKSNESLGEKVKQLEEKLSSMTKTTSRHPANKKFSELQLSRNQVEHLIRFKGCKAFRKQGQNFLACPEQVKSQNRFI
jgi:hypothetical protein